jgi:nicotinamide riboside kinase
MTKIVNLYGGSGVGKSTIAALLFARMKILGADVELVREYVKLWAWGGRKVRPTDQIYLLGKQSSYESALYGRVGWVVTDSPVMLAGAYAEWHSGEEGRYVTEAAKAFYGISEGSHQTTYLNYFLARDNDFESKGRYETEEEARAFDGFLTGYLARNIGPYVTVHGTEHEKARAILADIKCRIGAEAVGP